ncbi:hypothetical protein MOX01_02320 [Microbacterium oxydans]|nr:hypothetical protein MOX01_02320 [Microbacterium oxydans]
MHTGIDRLRLSPGDGGPPQGQTIRACDWALSSSSVPNGLLEGAAIVQSRTEVQICPPKGGQGRRKGAKLFLTHPPVVFGPHRSPRGEGHTIFGAPQAPCGSRSDA